MAKKTDIDDKTPTVDYLSNLKLRNGYAGDPEAILTRLLDSGWLTRGQVEWATAANKDDFNS
jgi:hypothetical protein